MPKKVTTKDFIGRARAVHGDKYGYAFSIYKSAHTKVYIHCPEHGMFEQSPNNHVDSGAGCPGCYGNKKHTNESFIQKAREIHGENTYCYSLVNYINATTKIKIICHKHGEFEQSPSNHINFKQGCPECFGTKKHTSQSYTVRAREIHGDRYDYSLIDYINARTKIIIICHEHGEFEQEASSHLQGVGCPGCSEGGFDRTKNGFLYILRSDCGRYMKIGITHYPEQRHSKLSRATPFLFNVIECVEGPGDQIANLEKELLAEFQPVGFTETFDGYSEWRLWDDSVRNKLKKDLRP